MLGVDVLFCRVQAAAVPKLASETDAEDGTAAVDSSSSGAELSPQEYRKKYNMWVLPQDAPAPYQTFEQARLPPGLLKAVSCGTRHSL